MDDNRLENKVDKISDDIVEIKIIMTENTASLKEHMRRTALAEKNILLLNSKFDEDIAQINSEISPIKSHVTFVNTTIKLIIVTAGIIIFLKQIGLLDNLILLLK